jgi:tetratricopeptide (TPR) repeat protein
MISATYSEIKRLRSTGKTAAALALLKSQPPQSDEDAFEAVVCLFAMGDIENTVHVCRTRAWALAWARHTSAALIKLLAEDNPQDALARARSAISTTSTISTITTISTISDPAISPDAQAFYLMMLQVNGHLNEAYAYVCAQPTPAMGETFLLTVMAEVSAAAKDGLRAYQLACAVIATDAENYRALMVLSDANFAFKNYHESLGNALCANQVSRGSPPATLQIMRCQNRLGDYYAAIAAFDAMAGADAQSPEIQIELGMAYAGLDRTAQATTAYRAALAASPSAPSLEATRALLKIYLDDGDNTALNAFVAQFAAVIESDIDCIQLLGLEQLRRGHVDEAAQRLRRCHDLNVQRDDAFGHLPWPVPEPRIRHDYEQLELLQRRGKLSARGIEALQTLKPYYQQSRDPGQTFAPEGHAATALKKALCEMPYCPDDAFTGAARAARAARAALGSNDYPALEAQYAAENLVVIDHFLSDDALAELRRFSEEATVWKLYNPGGYAGALLIKGYAPQVLLAIADELRRKMPRVIRDYPLLQAWGFKYDQRMQGITLHADFAKVNVNFWITPDAACADPTTGGMVVYNHPVPQSWTFADYNSNPDKLRAYLKVHEAKAQRVPYRENRCVMFDSSLIHVTDELHFKPGYENRRINVTLLFGRARSNE